MNISVFHSPSKQKRNQAEVDGQARKREKGSEVVLVNKPSIPWRHYLWRCQNKLSNSSVDHSKTDAHNSRKVPKSCHHYSASGLFNCYRNSHHCTKVTLANNFFDTESIGNYLTMKSLFQSSKSLSLEDFRSLGHSVRVSDEVENEYCEEKSVSVTPSQSTRVDPLEPSSLFVKNKRNRCLHRKCNAGLFYTFNSKRCSEEVNQRILSEY